MKMKLKITPQTKGLTDEEYNRTFDVSANGIMLYPKNYEEFPMPWDADLSIEEDNLVLEGHIGPSGAGYALSKIPLSKVSNYLDADIDVTDEYADEMKTLFASKGWM